MKLETMTVNIVECHELELHIRLFYAFEDPKGMFSIVAMEEWTNDSDHLYDLKKRPLDEWEQKDLDKWKGDPLGFHPYTLRPILQDMMNNGHLEEGKLLIRVCW